MKYKSVYLDGSKENIISDNIPENEFQNVKKYIKSIQEMMMEMDYYIIVRNNVGDFLNYADRDDIKTMEDFINLNRLFMNWLNTFYTWIEYHERRYNLFKSKLKSEYFDNVYWYRMAYFLRTHTTHNSWCIKRTEMRLIDGKVRYMIDADDLLKDEKINKTVRKDLLKIKEETGSIEAKKFTEEFFLAFEKIQIELWQNEMGNMQNVIDELGKYVKVENGKVFPSYIQSDEGLKRPLCTSFTFSKMNEKLQLMIRLSKEKIFENEIG